MQRDIRSRVTCRVFFKELLKSNLIVNTGEGEGSILATPSCARCHRLFGVGEVKEVEKRGIITKIKLNDTTAALNIYTDKELQCKTELFLAFIGNLHLREGRTKGGGFIIIVEEAGVVEEDVRNNWIVSTARRTMERIELLRGFSFDWDTITSSNAEKNALPGEQWMWEAVKHYAIDGEKLDALAGMAINAVMGVRRYYSKTIKEMVLEMVEPTSSMGRDKLRGELEKRGVAAGEWIEEVIEELIAEGRCYEPEVGVLKVV